MCVFPSVCLCVRSQSDQFKTVNRKSLQIWEACFQGQSKHDPLKFFEKGRGQGHMTP